MEYLNIHKENLTNLEISLNKEILRTNRSGSYASYSVVGCNTRKYHGLLIAPIENFNNDLFVLLSALDLTVITNDQEFNLSLHKFIGDYISPRGHKYIESFLTEEVPQLTYKIGAIRIVRECCLEMDQKQVLIRYHLANSKSKIKLRFTPYLAFRQIHNLSKTNNYLNSTIEQVSNGIKTCLYDGFPDLFLQLSKSSRFIPQEEWFYNIEYIKEAERGYDCTEDLFVPGYFEADLKQGDSIVFSASLSEVEPKTITTRFTQNLKKKIPRDNMKDCLLNSGNQFFYHKKKGVFIKTGYHWYNCRARDTFMALPGLCLGIQDSELYAKILDSSLQNFRNGLFPDNLLSKTPEYHTVDSSLWFIWAIQQYYMEYSNSKLIWEKYGKQIKRILNVFLKEGHNGIKVFSNGLISAGEMGQSPTWMNAIYQGKPITPRIGMSVELNALWYNSICFVLDLATEMKDRTFISKWKDYPNIIEKSFVENFWSNEKNYCADNIFEKNIDWSLRPNQLLAASLPYSPLSVDQKHKILSIIKNQLFTPKGLRTLAPGSKDYKGQYKGNAIEREFAAHQGTVYPWLLQHYCTAVLSVSKDEGKELLKKIIKEIEPTLFEHGIGTISELFDGDPPHSARGAISQATSVAAILYAIHLLEKLD